MILTQEMIDALPLITEEELESIRMSTEELIEMAEKYMNETFKRYDFIAESGS